MDCEHPAGFYGYCLGHEPGFVRAEFDRFVTAGVANSVRPKCYESDRKWAEYVVAFVWSSAPDRRASVRVEHCRDCTPSYRDEQHELGKCEHPETVFVRPDTSNGGVIGIPNNNKKDPRRWEQAMMGMLGAVVALPTSKAMDDVMRKMDALRKKAGRPKKEQTK